MISIENLFLMNLYIWICDCAMCIAMAINCRRGNERGGRSGIAGTNRHLFLDVQRSICSTNLIYSPF